MEIIFYRHAAGRDPVPPAAAPLPEGLEISFWQPSVDGMPKGVFASRANQIWWLMSKLGLFARPDFTVVAIHRGAELLHRLIVTPKWYRFPQMAARDLQMGMLWTDPAARGKGLARAAIEAVHARFAGQYENMWYLVEADNAASRRVIESFGYTVAGQGRRTAPLGLSPIGRFELDAPVRDA